MSGHFESNRISLAEFDRARVSRAVALGILFWFLGALAVRYGVQSGAFMGPARALFFVLTIPIMAGAVVLQLRFARSGGLAAMAIATAAAAFCDVVAMTWFPGLYAPDAATVLSGAVLLFWGIGWALALACWRNAA